MSIVCVAGMHRSGTSAVAKLLRDCGLDLGPLDELVPPDDFNQHGYWEHIRFVELNDDLLRALDAGWDHPPELPLRWRELAGLDQLLARAVEMVEGFSREPWGWKDPRNCLTLPFWRHVVPDLRVVLAIRNPLEVALSLRRRNFFSTAHSLSLWLDYNNRVEQATNPEDRIVVAYDSLLSDPTGELGRLIDFIGLEPDGYALKTAMAGVLPEWMPATLAVGPMVLFLVLAVSPGRHHWRGLR